MTQVITAGRSRGAHRSNSHGESSLAVSQLARVHRTATRPRPRPRPTPRPATVRPPATTHVRSLVATPRASAAAATLRDWAENRPFWAGLFLIVAGVEIGFWPATSALVSADRSGVSAVMFMALLVADGVAVWLMPQNRKLLGVQAAALGLLAMTTANLGGLFMGTCAAVAGGAMAFRWTRTPRPAEPAAPRPLLRAVPRPVEPTPEREVERTAELATESVVAVAERPVVEGEVVAELIAPEPVVARREVRRPKPAADATEDQLVALVADAQRDEESFIPGF
ncbi:MAG TPA: DUF6114 domain-containing protein [Jatrophihabitantaceae bacterium]|nr:DUF6114 domain-containing protein [Jatrophihabitantaceae bacterium]